MILVFLKRLLILFTFIISLNTFSAQFLVGSGITSVYNGRFVPYIYTGIENNNYGLSGYSAGVKSSYYYHNTYHLQTYLKQNIDSILGAKVSALFGFFGTYSKRYYKGSTNIQSEDIIYGPMVGVDWSLFDFLHIRMDHHFGIANFVHPLQLYFKDINTISIIISI
jgi:hypothetical protein